MWLLRIFNPVKLFYALTTAAVVAVAMALAFISIWGMDLSHWARVAVVMGIPMTCYFLWRQDRDTMCQPCTRTARPFASHCLQCHAWLPYSATVEQRMTGARTVPSNRSRLY